MRYGERNGAAPSSVGQQDADLCGKYHRCSPCSDFNTDERSFNDFLSRHLPRGYFTEEPGLYYYVEESSRSAIRSTDYRSRPGDGWRTSTLIWLDKQAVISIQERRLESDSRTVSRVGFLAFLSRRR